MYKIIHNNQIIDVMENIHYVKCLPRTQKVLGVDRNQANGITSSDGSTIYHIYGTPHTFAEKKKSVTIEQISKEEYLKLTTEMKTEKDLESRVKELEKMVQSLLSIIEGS